MLNSNPYSQKHLFIRLSPRRLLGQDQPQIGLAELNMNKRLKIYCLTHLLIMYYRLYHFFAVGGGLHYYPFVSDYQVSITAYQVSDFLCQT